MNSLEMLQALVFEPRKAFVALAERPKFLFPLVALILGTAGLVLWYYRVVDLEWFTDRQLRASSFAVRLSEAQIEAQIKSAAARPGVTATIATITTALGLIIGYLLVSVYYLLAGKVTNVQRSFRQWFALACWTSMPSLLTIIPAAFVLLTATSAQIDQSELRVLSLNSLFFHRTFGEPGFTLLTSIGLPEFLSVYLAMLGVKVWSGRSWTFSAIFTLLPLTLILGVVGLFLMGRS
jgi:Yip1 domain